VTAVKAMATFSGLTLTRAGTEGLSVSSTGLRSAATNRSPSSPCRPTQLKGVRFFPFIHDMTVGNGFDLTVAAEDPSATWIPPSGDVTVTLSGSAKGF